MFLSPHSDRLLQGRSEASRGDGSDLLVAVRGEYLRRRSGRRSHLRQPDPLFLYRFQLPAWKKKCFRAEEALFQSSAALWASCNTYRHIMVIKEKQLESREGEH